MKNSIDPIRNRTSNFPACSTVPQPTAPPPTTRKTLLVESSSSSHRPKLWMLHMYNPVGTVPSPTDSQTFPPVLGFVFQLFYVGGCWHHVLNIQNLTS
jgi:hypothetical protein